MDTPERLLAQWLEELPEAEREDVTLRVVTLMPGPWRPTGDLPAAVAALPAHIRSLGGFPLSMIGIVVMIGALVDHVFAAPSLNEDHSAMLDTEAAQQRWKFMSQQHANARARWAELRQGPLSTIALDRWTDAMVLMAARRLLET